MRVALIGPDLEENLSIRYLSSALASAGHTPQIVAFDTVADFERARAAAADADIIALSMCYQIRAREFLDLGAALKADRPDRTVIAGGHFASCAAAELLRDYPQLDLVVIHEGERTLAELADLPRWTPETLAGVRGIVFRGGDGIVTTPPRGIVEDLDTLPWPDRSGPARLIVGVPTAYMMGSRGCVSDCDYCAISTLHRLAPGKRFRQRDPGQIAEEMSWLYHERGVRQFVFHDDNFLIPSVQRNLDRIDALDRAIRRAGLRHIGLVLKCRPADVEPEVFRRLREMGLLRVFLGIESGTPEGLASLGRRQTVADAHRALQVCEDLGISTQYTIIMFHPEATPRTMRADLSFVRDHLAHPLSFCRAEAYAGTPLERRMIEASRAQGTYMAHTYRYSDPVTELIWSSGRELLASRCWSQTNLLGQIVRVDHLAAAFRHFYEGRDVDALVMDFATLELEVNSDTAALLEDLIAICDRVPEAGSPELQRGLAELRERERNAAATFLGRVCKLREAMHAEAYRRIGLARSTPQAAPQQGKLGQWPRHAAAAFLAIGLASCGGDRPRADSGVFEAPPPPMDSGFVDDGGAIEAPPPPMDSGFVDDGGAIEAPPPPMDSGFVDDGGVFEAPPPPMDSGSD